MQRFTRFQPRRPILRVATPHPLKGREASVRLRTGGQASPLHRDIRGVVPATERAIGDLIRDSVPRGERLIPVRPGLGDLEYRIMSGERTIPHTARFGDDDKGWRSWIPRWGKGGVKKPETDDGQRTQDRPKADRAPPKTSAIDHDWSDHIARTQSLTELFGNNEISRSSHYVALVQYLFTAGEPPAALSHAARSNLENLILEFNATWRDAVGVRKKTDGRAIEDFRLIARPFLRTAQWVSAGGRYQDWKECEGTASGFHGPTFVKCVALAEMLKGKLRGAPSPSRRLQADWLVGEFQRLFPYHTDRKAINLVPDISAHLRVMIVDEGVYYASEIPQLPGLHDFLTLCSERREGTRPAASGRASSSSRSRRPDPEPQPQRTRHAEQQREENGEDCSLDVNLNDHEKRFAVGDRSDIEISFRPTGRRFIVEGRYRDDLWVIIRNRGSGVWRVSNNHCLDLRVNGVHPGGRQPRLVDGDLLTFEGGIQIRVHIDGQNLRLKQLMQETTNEYVPSDTFYGNVDDLFSAEDAAEWRRMREAAAAEAAGAEETARIRPEDHQLTFAPSRDQRTIGSDRNNDFFVLSSEMAPAQLAIHWTSEGAWVVTDQGGSHPMLVNGRLAGSEGSNWAPVHAITDRTLVSVGPHFFYFTRNARNELQVALLPEAEARKVLLASTGGYEENAGTALASWRAEYAPELSYLYGAKAEGAVRAWARLVHNVPALGGVLRPTIIADWVRQDIFVRQWDGLEAFVRDAAIPAGSGDRFRKFVQEDIQRIYATARPYAGVGDVAAKAVARDYCEDLVTMLAGPRAAELRRRVPNLGLALVAGTFYRDELRDLHGELEALRRRLDPLAEALLRLDTNVPALANDIAPTILATAVLGEGKVQVGKKLRRLIAETYNADRAAPMHAIYRNAIQADINTIRDMILGRWS